MHRLGRYCALSRAFIDGWPGKTMPLSSQARKMQNPRAPMCKWRTLKNTEHDLWLVRGALLKRRHKEPSISLNKTLKTAVRPARP